MNINLSILLKVIFLCKFEEIGDYKLLYDRYCSILNKEEKTQKFINLKNQVSVTTLIGFGSQAHFFFILYLTVILKSLPCQVTSLKAGLVKILVILQPNFEDINWQETLVEKICTHFEPQFNAHCKRNVIGEPNGNTEWFAKIWGSLS